VDIVLGTLVKPLGLQGELKLRDSADFWDAALESSVLHVEGPAGKRPIRVTRARSPRAGSHALVFEGVTTRDEAERLVGAALTIDGERLDVPLPSEPLAFQLVGVDVLLPDETVLGQVQDLLHLPAHDVFVVGKGEREWLVPNVPAFVRELDLGRRVLRITPIPGLLES